MSGKYLDMVLVKRQV